MATHTTTSFQLNSPVPIDTRLVVGGTNSFYLDKDDITNKYDGLRVWDLTGSSPGDPGTPYVWYDGSWVNEGSSGISGSGTAGHLPKFIGSGSFVTNSIITENSSNIGIGFSPTASLSAKLHINGTVRSEGNGFYGRGSNITNINADNITSGILLLPRLQNGSAGQVLTAGPSSPIWKNIEKNYLEITYNSLESLKINNSLVPGTRYYITDRDIWIDALGTDKLSMECKRHFRIVKDEHYTPHNTTNPITNAISRYLGIYGQTYAKGSTPNSSFTTFGTSYFAIWGGRMWYRNSSSADVPGSSNVTIAGGWTIQPTTNNTYYESKIFDIKYNFDDDKIWEQSDDRGNKIKRQSNTTSSIDITDWGNSNIYNNENFGIFNNFRNATTKATIYNNTNNGGIYNNSNNGGIYNNNSNNGGIYNNSNNGIIYSNSNTGAIYNNSNGGAISSNSNIGGIYSNLNNGAINSNSNDGNIYNNSNIGNISANSNNGYIFNNSNKGTINNNSNSGYIYNNSNLSGINSNSISGNIFNNRTYRHISSNNGSGDISNNDTSVQYISGNYVVDGINNNKISGDIINNNILGGINDNLSSVTYISHNRINGWISDNDNGSRIYYNKNNGSISNNVGIGSTSNIDINFNDNNGYISYNVNYSYTPISIANNSSSVGNIGDISFPIMRTTSIFGSRTNNP